MGRRETLQPRHLSRANKLARGLWGVVWLVLFRPTPRPLHAWRCFLLKLFGARIGRRVRVYPSARIWAPWQLEMAEGSTLGDWVDCYSVDRITIGERSVVSQYSFLCSASHDYLDPERPLVTAPIVIGADAWIAADVFVGPGVIIGEGAVVTARSSVFGDIEPWVVARGNPACAVKPRMMKGAAASAAELDGPGQ